MKTQLHYLLMVCFGLLLWGAPLNSFAWGGDIRMPSTGGYNYSNARISVAYDGTIYYGRIFASKPTGPADCWEILRSGDNGLTFTRFLLGTLGGSSKCTALDILCAGNTVTDFRLFVARSFLDTLTGSSVLYMGKFTNTGSNSMLVYETYNYSPARGWVDISMATDCRERNAYSNPYVISLAAAKAGGADSLIIWTDNVGGTALHRRGLYGTGGFIRHISTSVGSTSPGTSGYGRLGISWDEFQSSTAEWGSVYMYLAFPDDGADPSYSGPYKVGASANSYRKPCIVLSENTDGGSGPGGQDLRAIVTVEYINSKFIWGAVFDSVVKVLPQYTWCMITSGLSGGVSSQCHGVYDPMYDNFLFTYYDNENNTLPYVIKPLDSPAQDAALYFKPNYRDAATLSGNLMYPRVDMSISRGRAAFAWNDNSNNLFDAEWSTALVAENALTGIEGVLLYPNPATDLTNISFSILNAQRLNMTVHELTGKELFRQEYYVTQGDNQLSFSVNTLTTGNYIVRLNGPTVNASLWLVVTK